MKIYLIGMPGSGKTTLGIKLAEELAMPFIDLDNEIEQHEGKSIPEIFLQHGEDYFRQTESRLLRQWAGSEQSFVMATGGGAPCFFDGIGVINESGLSVFLDAPVDDLVKRLEADTGRPLLVDTGDEEKKIRLDSLRSERLKFYRQARISLSTPDFPNLLKAIRISR